MYAIRSYYEQLSTYLANVTQPIEITASLDDSDKSSELRSLLTEIAELSNLITLTESRDDTERKPSFRIIV